MKTIRLPKLNKTVETPSLDELPQNESKEKGKSEKLLNLEQEEINKMMNYLQRNDSDKKFVLNTFYKKSANDLRYKFSNFKKNCINPSDIIEEVKQKYDFHQRLKELSTREE